MFKIKDRILDTTTKKYYTIQDDLGSYYYAVSETPFSNSITEIKLVPHGDSDFIKIPSFEEELDKL